MGGLVLIGISSVPSVLIFCFSSLDQVAVGEVRVAACVEAEVDFGCAEHAEDRRGEIYPKAGVGVGKDR